MEITWVTRLRSKRIGNANQPTMRKRYGMVIGLRAEQVAEYKRLHAAVWPEVLRMIRECRTHQFFGDFGKGSGR